MLVVRACCSLHRICMCGRLGRDDNNQPFGMIYAFAYIFGMLLSVVPMPATQCLVVLSFAKQALSAAGLSLETLSQWMCLHVAAAGSQVCCHGLDASRRCLARYNVNSRQVGLGKLRPDVLHMCSLSAHCYFNKC